MLIYIVGYMGSGKTTFGKKLASALNYHFFDTDKMLETNYKTTIGNLFKKYGEHNFRIIETKILKETFCKKNSVISTGGGLPCFEDNMILINKNGKSIYLKRSIEVLFKTLKSSQAKTRPLLEDLKENELFEFISKHLALREEYYNLSNYTIIKDDIAETINLLNGN